VCALALDALYISAAGAARRVTCSPWHRSQPEPGRGPGAGMDTVVWLCRFRPGCIMHMCFPLNYDYEMAMSGGQFEHTG
jgi:hypothetical protein